MLGDGGAEVATFWGSFHELRSPDRLVQTQSMEGVGDGAILNTLTFEDLGDGRTRLTDQTLAESFEMRDMILSTGMEDGVVAGYKKLDALLGGRSDPVARRLVVAGDPSVDMRVVRRSSSCPAARPGSTQPSSVSDRR